MKIVFMGTPEFAAYSLEKVYDKYGISAIFTKADRRNMRNNKVKYSQVKEFGLNKDIPVYQPENINNDEIFEILKSINPDIIVVVAYGKIIPKKIIDLPKYGIINVHASLLPKYRGASPIQSAIINGDKVTGVTIMYIEEGLDEGDMILKREVIIDETDNFMSLHDKLKIVGADTLLEALENIFKGNLNIIKQNHNEATFVKPIKKEDTQIKWDDTVDNLFNLIRGIDPFPGAYSILNDKIFKIHSVEKINENYKGSIGEIVDIIKNKGPIVKVNNGALLLTRVKPENKKILTGQDIINGNYIKIGDIFN
ncbi:MAG: methionyl-tRNA formyltransferase [Fusobacteria bacterium]|nr:methionyl-tRNA formyltransferase [Fusobacteriota bacterium]